MDIYWILIWIFVIIVGSVGFIGLALSSNKLIFKFMCWFIVSLLIVFGLVSMVSNLFVLSFIISLFIAFIGSKE